ncbi:hypothetical protein ABT332_06520 [Saccharomonospora azurea]|uniref:hypothetical protein n=1 Tax=Saccharomonospora azurea TaxID=40988 RepID=UPI00332E0A67
MSALLVSFQGDPEAFAASQRRLFEGHRLHVGNSRIAHAVAWAPWINGLTLPVPLCRQGWSGTGASGELLPTRFPVTCRRCRRLRGEDTDTEQPALFAL